MVHGNNHRAHSKVAIIGAGFVGSTAAYALTLQGIVSEIALIDVCKKKAEGEAADLMHGMQFTSGTHVVAGDDMKLIKGASIVIITAGIGQKPGQSRSDLLATNVKIFKELIPAIIKHNKTCILLVVTNPLDVLTYITLKLSGFEPCRVFGTGTVLDTARLRFSLGEYFEVSPKDIDAFILGEHGDAEFAWWSQARIGGAPLDTLARYDQKQLNQIFNQTKNAAADVIEKKGFTNFAIGLVIAKIVRAILSEQSRVFSVSTYQPEVAGVKDVCLSLPTIVRLNGVCDHIPLILNDQEYGQLRLSAQKIRHEINQAESML
jgi:L-lactate dehydrogenase